MRDERIATAVTADPRRARGVIQSVEADCAALTRGTQFPPSETHILPSNPARLEGRWADSGQDVRYAVRTAVRTPSVAILAVLAFALGIGVTTAVFSIFNGVLLAPLPFPDPERARRRLRHAAGLRHLSGVVPEVPRLEDAEPGVRRDGRLDAGVLRADRARARRAGERRCPRPRRSTTSSASSRCSGAGTRRTRISPADPRSSSSPTSSGSAASAATVGRRPHADLRRRALRSDRRHAGDLHASQRRLLRAAPAQARSGDARQSLPRHLRAARSPACRSIAPRGRCARSAQVAGEGVRPQPRHRRPLATARSSSARSAVRCRC